MPMCIRCTLTKGAFFLSIEATLELMISFATLVALLIFGILEATKNDKK
ncbi:putative holin-like toxin [Enterococcus faecalis]